MRAVVKKIQRLHYLYEINSGVYMLEPWEKILFNSIVIGFLAMSAYTSYIYMPRYAKSVLSYFGYWN